MAERKWPGRLRRVLLTLLAITLIGMAAVVGSFRLLLPQAPEYREQIADWAGEAVGWPVSIEEMDVRWRLLVPEMVFSDVRLHPEEGANPFARAEELRVRFSLLDLARPGPLRPGRVVVDGADLMLLRGADGQFRVPGVAFEDEADAEIDWREVLERVLTRADYRVEDSRLVVRDAVHDLGPWEVGLETVWLRSAGHEHEFDLALDLPAALGGHLSLAAEASGPAARPEHWAWSGDLELAELALGGLQPVLPDGWVRPFTASLDLDARIQGGGARPRELAGRLSLEGLSATDPGPVMTGPDRTLPRLDLAMPAFSWHSRGDGWRFTSGDLEVSSDVGDWPVSAVNLEGGPDDQLTGQLRYLRLQDLAPLLTELAGPGLEEADWLDRLAPEGEVRNLSLSAELDDWRPQAVGFNLRVSGAGFAPWDDKPGVSGISGWLAGRLDADSGSGHFEVDSGPLVVDWPGRWRQPVEISRLSGDLDWSREGDLWRMATDELRGRGLEGRARAEGEVSVVPGETPHMDFTAELLEGFPDNVRHLSRWLPVDLLDPQAVAWLDRAPVAGTVEDAHVRVRGTVEAFPYASEDEDGVFAAAWRAEDAVLDYEEGWPQASGLTLGGMFHESEMRAAASTGEIGGFRIDSAGARVADLYDPELALEATGEGALGDGLDFLRTSPLGEFFAEPLAPVTLEGGLGLELALEMPLEDPAATRVDGLARIRNASGGAEWLPGHVEALEGDLAFTEEGVSSESLRARYLGGEVTARIDPGDRARDAEENAPPETRVDLEGRAEVTALRSALPEIGFLERAEGAFDWTGDVRFPNGNGGGGNGGGDPEVRLRSGLLGVSLDVPEPVGKTRDQARLLAVRFNPRPDPVRVHAHYGDGIAVAMNVARGTGVTGVRVHHGEPIDPVPVAPGIRSRGYLPELRLDDWLAYAGDAGIGGDLELVSSDLRVGRLRLGPLELQDQSLRLRPGHVTGFAEWSLRLDEGDAVGRILIPHEVMPGRNTIHLDLERLRLRDLQPPAGEEGMFPERLPGLSLQVEALYLAERPLGALEARLRPRPGGLSLDELRLDSEIVSARLTGDWLRDPVTGEQSGNLAARIDSGNVGEIFQRIGMVPSVEADFGHLSGRVHWEGPPGMRALHSLGGRLSLELRDGALREVQAGAGRFFGLISPRAMPRRLFGDFDDVFGEGLGFDTISGDFFLLHGDAHTGNLRVEAPGGNAWIHGRTGLASRDYDQFIRVEAPVGAVLPVAGAIAGGTGVGAAMLVVSEMFSGPLARMSRTEHRITGSWDNPRLQPLDGEEDEDDNSETRLATDPAGD